MPKPLYIVSHVPKTAGSTLHSNFSLNFPGAAWVEAYVPAVAEARERLEESGPAATKEYMDEVVRSRVTERTRCIFGHWAYFGVHRVLPPELQSQLIPRYILFLRRPVERVISQYRYHARNAAKAQRGEIYENAWSFEEWFESSQNLRRFDGQVRHLLLGDSPEADSGRRLGREELEIAKRNLREFWFVGLTEHFDDDAHYLYGKLSFTSYGATRTNTSPPQPKLPETLLERIREENQLDSELYDYALQLRRGWLQEHEAEYRHCIRKAMLLRQLAPARSWASRVKRACVPGGAKS